MRVLKVLRVERNLTQYDISRLTGISQSRVSLIENGQRRPSDEDLDKLSVCLGIAKNTLSRKLRRWESTSNPAVTKVGEGVLVGNSLARKNVNVSTEQREQERIR